MQAQRLRYTNSKETARHLLMPIVTERREECVAEIARVNLRTEVRNSTLVQALERADTVLYIRDRRWMGSELLILDTELEKRSKLQRSTAELCWSSEPTGSVP